MIGDYILRDAAKVKIWKCPETLLPTQEAEDYLIAQIDSIRAADVRPVMLCKDCKWFNPTNSDWCCEFEHGLIWPCEDDFCSFGERREGGDRRG